MSSAARPARFACAVVAVALLSAAPVRAQDAATEEAKVHFKAATEAFKQGDYEEALAGYHRAYDLKPLPAFLFNIGQCFYNMGRYAEARDAYRRFLAADDVPADRRAAVEQMLADVDRKLAAPKPPTSSTSKAPTGSSAKSSSSSTSLSSSSSSSSSKAVAPPPLPTGSTSTSPPTSAPVAPAPAPAADDGADDAAAPSYLVPALIVGGGVVAAAVIVGAGAAGLWAITPGPVVPPSGTAGTLDRRGAAP